MRITTYVVQPLTLKLYGVVLVELDADQNTPRKMDNNISGGNDSLVSVLNDCIISHKQLLQIKMPLEKIPGLNATTSCPRFL